MELGSGWGATADRLETIDTIAFEDLPAMGKASIAGHAGKLLYARSASTEILVFQGRRHLYEGAGLTPLAFPAYLFKKLGCQAVLLTNAAGGINPGFSPGDLMCLADHINLMGVNPLMGDYNPVWGERFPDMSEVYCPNLRGLLRTAANNVDIDLKQGIYAAFSGPSYETPAEIRMLATIGADAIGMSTIPSAILSNAAGLKVAALSCITNLAAGISLEKLNHHEVTDTGEKSKAHMQALVLEFIKLLDNSSDL